MSKSSYPFSFFFFGISNSTLLQPTELTLQNDIGLVITSLMPWITLRFPTYFPAWTQKIYAVDNPTTPLAVPNNKGRESMVYLMYVVLPRQFFNSLSDSQHVA